MRSYLTLLILFVCIFPRLSAQTDTEFWITVPEVTWQHHGTDGEPTYLHFSALDAAATVTVTMPTQALFTPITINIPANTSQTIDLTDYIRSGYVPNPADVRNPINIGVANDANILECGFISESGTIQNKGIYIQSSALVTCYLERDNSNNNDIWALKGANALGSDFYVPMQNSNPNKNYNSDPKALAAILVIAAEDVTLAIRPTATIATVGWAAGAVQIVNLQKGQVLPLVAETRCLDAHLGGTRIWSVSGSGKFSVIWKDDSVWGYNNSDPSTCPDAGGCYDLMGDQMIPLDLAGDEYIVMRGELNVGQTDEYVYLMSLSTGTEIEFNNVGGTNPANITLGAPGTISRVLLNESAANTIDALHMKSVGGEDFIVYHVTGFGCEKGTAILPTIRGCTGSTEVSVQRSTNEGFFLNIMTKAPHIGDFVLQSGGVEYTIPDTWFTEIPNSGVSAATNWYYLDKAWNEFTNAHGGIPAAPVGEAIKVYNTSGIFHLAVINGGSSSGCRYGYFSDFTDDYGSAFIGDATSDLITFCQGDTIQLQARGGVSYFWENNNNPVVSGTFVDGINTISSPLVVPPTAGDQYYYKCTITRACYLGADPDTTIDVSATGYPEIIADFDTVKTSPQCCSPFEMQFVNTTTATANMFQWTIDTIGGSISTTSYNPANVVFRNESLVSDTVDVTLRASYSYNCPNQITKRIPIHPELKAAMYHSPPEGCQQEIVVDTFQVISTGAAFTHGIWSWGDGTGTTYFDSVPGILDSVFTHTFTNLTNYDTTYYVYLILEDSITDCSDTSLVEAINVPGVARARYSMDNSKGCSPLDVKFTNYSNGIVDYEWWFYNGNDTASFNPDREGSAGSMFSDTTITYVNTGTAPVEYYALLHITKNNDDGTACHDYWGIDTITIYPEFDITISPDNTAGCNPLTLDFSSELDGAKILPNMSYEWKFGDGTSSGVEDPGTKTYKHTKNTDQNYTVSLIATSEYNCVDTAPSKVMTVYSYVDSRFTISPDTIGCSPFQVEVSSNISANSYIDTTWTHANATMTEVTAGKTFTLDYVNAGTANEIHSISLFNTNPHACDSVFEREIVVKPHVTAEFTTDNALICHRDTIQFTNASYFTNVADLITGATATYEWDFGDGTTSSLENPQHRYLNTENNGTTAQSFTVSLTIYVDGCTETVSHTIAVYPAVTANFVSPEYIFCAPLTQEITNTSTGANDYLWQFSDGTADEAVSDMDPFDHDFLNGNLETTETVTITLTASNDFCSSVRSRNYVVYPEVHVNFTQDVTEGCNPLTVNFTNTSTGMLTYNWDFRDGQNSPDASPTHTFSHIQDAAVVYPVTLYGTQAVTGCTDSAKVDITTYSYIEAKFGLRKTDETKKSAAVTSVLGGCHPFDVTITDSSTNNGTWRWNYGDGTTEDLSSKPAPFSRVYNNTGHTANEDYTITLVKENDEGCTVSTSRTLTVYPVPLSDFSFTADNCHPHPVAFTNETQDDGGNTTYFWDLGDGSTTSDKNPTHTYTNYSYTVDSVYAVNLSTSSNYRCTHDTSFLVTVYPKPKASFSPDVKTGCAPLDVTFTDLSTGQSLNAIQWNFDDGAGFTTNGAPGGDVSYTFDNTYATDLANYKVQIAIETSNGCQDTIAYTITAYPKVEAGFTYNEAGCSPHRVEFVNTSNDAVDTYYWDLGYSGEVRQVRDPIYTYYNQTGSDEIYTVTYIGSSRYGCSDTVEHDVTVYPTPVPEFDINMPLQTYPDTVFEITNLSPSGDYDFYWTIGDGTPEFLENETVFNVAYTGWAPVENNSVYYITLRAEGARCTGDNTHQLSLLPPDPVITITNSDPNGCVPLTVHFETEKQYANSYYWEFGDGDTSTEEQPTHVFDSVGIFNVKVTAIGDGGDAYDYQPVAVYALPTVNFSYSPDSVMLPSQAVQFFNTTQNAHSYLWDFGDGSVSSQENPSYQYTEEGQYYVTLFGYSSKGCIDSLTSPTYIKVSGEGRIQFPNAFLPNADSPAKGTYTIPDEKNDVFHPHYYGVKEYSLYIYNRWGEQLFVSNNIEEGWNGRYNNEGETLPQGVYFFKSTGKFYNDIPFKLSGDVTLIRK